MRALNFQRMDRDTRSRSVTDRYDTAFRTSSSRNRKIRLAPASSPYDPTMYGGRGRYEAVEAYEQEFANDYTHDVERANKFRFTFAPIRIPDPQLTSDAQPAKATPRPAHSQDHTARAGLGSASEHEPPAV